MKKIIELKLVSVVAAAILLNLLILPVAFASERDAKNLITVATGSLPSSNDPRIPIVELQLSTIQENCASAGFHDKLAKAHSLLTVKQSLLQVLADFVIVSRVQCAKLGDSTLVTLYVLERNAGASHSATINRLTKNPSALVAKWSARRSG